VLTPEVAAPARPVEIINPYVPQKAPAAGDSDRSAAHAAQPRPLVVINPFVAPSRSVAQQ
jgi:hypothetical protein